MPKVKVHRSQPSLDMTPMVDLAFLLVTFFMLTTKFAPEEPLAVDTPTSTSEIKLPDTDILTISVSRQGAVFFNLDNKYTRTKVLDDIGQKYNVSFSPEEVNTFSVMSSFGVPIGSLKEFLSMDQEQRKAVRQPGIPCDSAHNELRDWIILSRVNNRKLRVAIKGDQDASYPVVKTIINTLIDNKVTRFNLITNMENES